MDIDSEKFAFSDLSNKDLRELFFKPKQSEILEAKIPLIDKIKDLAKTILGYIVEFFSFLALSALYFFPEKHLFDPQEKDIKKDNQGIAKQKSIILVHGYLHNSSAWRYHRYKLQSAGFDNVYTVDLGAVPTKSITEYAEVLSKRVEEVKKMTKRNDIHLIGHSMGGVVSAHYVFEQAKRDKVNVTDVITLNSPLQGTKMHLFGPGACAREMAHDSDFIDKLSKKVASSRKTRFLHFSSKADLVVFPHSSALNAKTEKLESPNPNVSRIVTHLGHCAILFSPETLKQEINYLTRT